MRKLCLLFLVLACTAKTAFATCTTSGYVNAPTTILAANDIATGRHYLLVQNTGLSNAMNLSIGAPATTSDLYLGAGASLVLTTQQGGAVPNGGVSITSAGTTWAACDY